MVCEVNAPGYSFLHELFAQSMVWDHRETSLEQQQTEKIETEVRDVDRIQSTKCTLAVQGGLLGGHKSAPLKDKHMLFHQAFSSPLINEDLPVRSGPQLVFTFKNRLFRQQVCYSLLPARPCGKAERVVGLYRYTVRSLFGDPLPKPIRTEGNDRLSTG